jgi:hypothetical protein
MEHASHVRDGRSQAAERAHSDFCPLTCVKAALGTEKAEALAMRVATMAIFMLAKGVLIL